MLYEKKMLILSGDGKGVVLIEKSAHGARFSLRTFDLPHYGELKAGIVTRSAVHVRDLPQTNNPSAVFVLDNIDLDALHFAVFDTRLRLYGTNTERMWEANIMDLLTRHEKRTPFLERREPAALPPIADPPRVLPMPDGTGIPQSRMAIYGDEALAETDFYTSLDIESRMPAVDGFLDGRRITAALPTITPPNVAPGLMYRGAEQATYETDGVNAEHDDVFRPTHGKEGGPILPEKLTIEAAADEQEQAASERELHGEQTVEVECVDASHADEHASQKAAVRQAEEVPIERREAAAASDGVRGEMPWELTARWLKRRRTRIAVKKNDAVRAPSGSDRVRKLRASDFIERVHSDIKKLFENAPKDERLSALLPDVEWVKVDFDGNTISVGRGGNAFLCYAVPGVYEKVSPLGDCAQWLPGSRSESMGKGYWLIFQNTTTGEIIQT